MRGQVAFLAVIGVLVIVGVVGTIMIFSDPAPPPRQFTGAEGFAVEQCAQAAFDESIALAALYGGWLDAPLDSFDMGGREFVLWADPASVPSRVDLQRQVRDDLVERLDRCTFDLVGSGSVSADVQLGSVSRAAIEIDASIVVDGAQQRLAPFVVESRLPVVRARDAAEEFTGRLWADEVLTDLNFELIALNPGVPLEGVEFSCAPKRWSVSEVSDSFFSTAQDSMAFVSFDGSARVSSEPLRSRLTFDLGLDPDVDVSAYYFTEYGGELSVDQSSGDVMSSYVVSNPDGSICQNTYQFWYSMNYPVVFTLSVPGQGEEFLFRFAVPVSVQRNQVSGPVSGGDASFCSDVTPRLFSLDIVDSASGESLDGVLATFVCDGRRCPLASSGSRVEDHLPARCIAGSIVLDHEGYAHKEVSYRYDQPLSGSTIELDPLRRISVELSCSSGSCSFSDALIARIDGRPYPLRVGENLIPADPDRVLVLRSSPSGPVLVHDLTLRSGDGTIMIDTDRYADSDGLSTQQIFGSHVVSDSVGGSP